MLYMQGDPKNRTLKSVNKFLIFQIVVVDLVHEIFQQVFLIALVDQKEGSVQGGLFCQQFMQNSARKFSEKVSVSSCSINKQNF